MENIRIDILPPVTRANEYIQADYRAVKRRVNTNIRGRFRILCEVISDIDGMKVTRCISTHKTLEAAEKKLEKVLKKQKRS